MRCCNFKGVALAVGVFWSAGARSQTPLFNMPPAGAVLPKAGLQAWCRNPEVIRNIIVGLNGVESVKRTGERIIDFGDATTEKLDIKDKSFACRGVAHASNGQMLPGIFSVKKNAGGETIWLWTNDDGKSSRLPPSAPPSANAGPSSDQAPLPADQLAFLDAVINARNAYESSKSDFQKGALRPARAKAICSVLKVRLVRNWAGKVVTLTTNGDGWGVLGVQVGPEVRLRTAATSLVDIGYDTLIRPTSSLFSTMGQLQKGDFVRFSGEFLAGDADCVRESSLTMTGSMTEPEFMFRFSKLERVDGN